jgi:hypothetical protein
LVGLIKAVACRRLPSRRLVKGSGRSLDQRRRCGAARFSRTCVQGRWRRHAVQRCLPALSTSAVYQRCLPALFTSAVYQRLQALAIAETDHRIPLTTVYGATETQGVTVSHWATERVGLDGLPLP